MKWHYIPNFRTIKNFIRQFHQHQVAIATVEKKTHFPSRFNSLHNNITLNFNFTTAAKFPNSTFRTFFPLLSLSLFFSVPEEPSSALLACFLCVCACFASAFSRVYTSSSSKQQQLFVLPTLERHTPPTTTTVAGKIEQPRAAQLVSQSSQKLFLRVHNTHTRARKIQHP